MSSLFLFSSAKPESCNVAINEEHVPLTGEETELEQFVSQPRAVMSAGLCHYLLLGHRVSVLVACSTSGNPSQRDFVHSISTECGHAQQPRALGETQNHS